MERGHDIDRRKLLEALGLGLLLPVLGCTPDPGDEGIAPAEAGPEDFPWPLQQEIARGPNPFVAPALERARSLGKPLLVFVVPEDMEKRWERQNAFGEFLEHCSQAALLDLSLCEVLCASRTDLAVHVPAAAQAGDPLLVLVDVEGELESVRDELPRVPEVTFDTPRGGAFDEAVLARVAALERIVHGLVASNAQALLRLASTAEDHLDRERIDRIETFRAGTGVLDPRVADEGAALVRPRLASADGDPELRQGLFLSLVAGTTYRLREGPPFGARWARSTGCGSSIEEVPDGHPAAGEFGRERLSGVSCGMAHVPQISQRFLIFWGNPFWS